MSKNNAYRTRFDFSKIPATIQIPNLIEVQKRSYERFLQMDRLPSERDDAGLQAVFQSVFPISDFRNVSQLEFVDFAIGNWECKVRTPQRSASPAHHLQKLRLDRHYRSVSSRRCAVHEVRHLQRKHPRLLQQVRRPRRTAAEV
jgi:DNA-directed RNA polymerase beta subunit